MSKPRSKRESWYYTWLWELRYLCHSRQFKKWLKRQSHKAQRRFKPTEFEYLMDSRMREQRRHGDNDPVDRSGCRGFYNSRGEWVDRDF